MEGKIHDADNGMNSETINNQLKNELLPPLVQEYESFIDVLQQQISMYKSEHQLLRKELSKIVLENQQLSDNLKEALSNKLAKEALLSPRHRKDTEMVLNLQHQLSLTAQEKDSALEMWQMAVKETEALEEQLKMSRDNIHMDASQKKMEEMKNDFSAAITMLEAKLSTTKGNLSKEKERSEELQKKVQTLQTENNMLVEKIKLLEASLATALTDQCSKATKLQELENKTLDLQAEIEVHKESEKELESALSKCHEHIEKLIQKEREAREKVADALSLIDCAVLEKEAALQRELIAKEENTKLQKLMSSFVDEAAVQVKEAVEDVKKRYNKKLEVLLHDMKKIGDEKNEAEQLLQREKQEKKCLEEELEKLRTEMLSKRESESVAIIERKLDVLYKDLAEIERQNFELVNEKENLLSELESQKQRHCVEQQQKDLDVRLLEENFNRMKIDMDETLRSKDLALLQVERLKHHVKALERELDNVYNMTDKDLRNAHRKRQLVEREELMAKLEEVEKEGAKTAKELQHHLESQQLIKNKYKKAIKTLTEKFEKRIQELRSETSTLKKEKMKLQMKLGALQQEVEEYQQSSYKA